MEKRGQVTLFIVLGLVILVIVGVVIYLYMAVDNPGKKITKPGTFPDQVRTIKKQISDCLDEVVDAGIWEYGANKDALDSFIRSRINDCINLDSYSDLIISPGSIDISVKVVPLDAIYVTLNYPLTIRKGDFEESFDTFKNTFRLYYEMELDRDSNGAVLYDFYLKTDDDRIRFKIPKGSIVNSDKITLVLVDPVLPYTFGPFEFQFGPRGTTFRGKRAQLAVDYDPARLSPRHRSHQDDLSISWFDSSRGLGISYPSYTDTDKRIIHSEIDEFH